MKYWFKVTDRQYSREILKMMFKLGYSWNTRGNQHRILPKDRPYIFMEEDTGYLTYSNRPPSEYNNPEELKHYKKCNIADLYANYIPKYKNNLNKQL